MAHQNWAPAEKREATAKLLSRRAASLTTAAMQAFADEYPWFSQLDAEHRSWISLVARAGIDSFISWLKTAGKGVMTRDIFDAAPRSLMRFISLHQTVELVRTTIDTVERSVDEIIPAADRDMLRLAIVYFSREVAFDAASVYARAAEMRGLWDERLETLIVDSVIRGVADDSVLSRASAMGWHQPDGVVVVVGSSRKYADDLRQLIMEAGYETLIAPQGDRLVLIIGGKFSNTAEVANIIRRFGAAFGSDPIVIGDVVPSLETAHTSARNALAGARAVKAWPECPNPVTATELLPERALNGDGHARRTLARDIFLPLAANRELLETLTTFFETGESIEATAREMYIHANTVRYRIKRIAEITGLWANESRGAYTLRLALSLGRLLN